MNTILIKRTDFIEGEQMYDVIKEKWNLPDFFGKNADALWDMITGHIELPAKVILQGFNKEETEIDKLYINKIIKVFKDAQNECTQEFYLEFID